MDNHLLRLMIHQKPVHDTARGLLMAVIAIAIIIIALFLFKPEVNLFGQAINMVGCTDKDYGLDFGTASECYSVNNDGKPIMDTCISSDNVLEMHCQTQHCRALPQSCSEYCTQKYSTGGYCLEGRCVCG